MKKTATNPYAQLAAGSVKKAAAKPKADKKPATAPVKADKKAAVPAKATAKPKADKKPATAKPEGHKSTDALKEAAKEYSRTKEVKTAGGNASVDCADDVATKLRGMSLADVYAAAAKTLEVTVKELQDKYGHLNVGMQRMNLGNRIRGVVNAK